MLETLDYTIRIGSTPMTNLFIFRFVSLLCLRRTRLFAIAVVYKRKIAWLVKISG